MLPEIPRYTGLNGYTLTADDSHGYLRTIHCGPSYQAEILLPFAKELLKIQKTSAKNPAWILDVGSGMGEGADYLEKITKKRFRCIQYDLSLDALSQSSGVRIQGYADQLSLEDNSVRGVVCKDVWPHLLNKPKFLSELWRITQPNGLVLLVSQFYTVPDDNEDAIQISYEAPETEKKVAHFVVESEEEYHRYSAILRHLYRGPPHPPYTKSTALLTAQYAREQGFSIENSFLWRPDETDWHVIPQIRYCFILKK